jgi:hypothetical protein
MNSHPNPTVFLPMTQSMRVRIERTIRQLAELLDEIDGDPNFEVDADGADSHDAEPD